MSDASRIEREALKERVNNGRGYRAENVDQSVNSSHQNGITTDPAGLLEDSGGREKNG